MSDTEKLEGLAIGLDRRGEKSAANEIRQAIKEIEEWRACARYDPLMSGAQFKGWDRSQMDRCRRNFVESKP